MPSLAALALPFRDTYLDHDAITRQLRAWADAFPGLCRLESIGVTDEGRDLWVLTVGPEPERARPAVWVDGNMHASEVAGSSVALAIAEDALRLHLDPDAAVADLPPHTREVLRDVLFVVMPRMSPDGAERILKDGRFVRSSPRDERPARAAPRWERQDIDGDGLALAMRVVDPAGEYVALEGAGSALRPRRVEDEGPFYRLFPEGVIAGFDGETIPEPYYLSDNATDLNRNFPVGWRGEPHQTGAGLYPLSEPESRAVVAYTSARPHLFAWMNLHCFGGVFIRPSGDAPDSSLDRDELALFRQLEQWAELHAGYPTVSGFHEFTYEPDKPLHGDLVDYAWEGRGCLAWAVEIWDIFAQLGLQRPKRFVDYYERMSADDLSRLVAFDSEHNDSRMFPAWRPVDHPQLGPVEVGGFDPRVGLWNPPLSELAGICGGLSRVFLRVAAMAPRLDVAADVTPLGEGLHQLTVTVTNVGYLATYGIPSARELPHNEPVQVEVASAGGVDVVGPATARAEIGHLEGWGRGRFNASQSLLFPESRGSSNRARHRLVLRGAGEVTVRVGSCRVGWSETRVVVSS